MSNLLNINLYRKFHQYLPILCVDIILKTVDGKFLMVKRKKEPAKGKWWFVGGRVFKNESLEQAIRRKVKEEIGLTSRNVEKIIGGYEIMFKEDPFSHGNGTHNNVTCFLSEIENIDNIKLDNLHYQYKLFTNYRIEWHHYLKECLSTAGFSANN
jgi:colanic acid biosynthesis protein WcaH